MYTNYRQRKRYYTNSYQTRRLSLGRHVFNSMPLVCSYPSYLGVPIFDVDEKDMDSSLLGLTNGKMIIRKKDLDNSLKEFVLFHEEEHVKDMDASEFEVDRRATRRFFRKHGKLTNDIIDVLKMRWKNIYEFTRMG